MDVLKRDFTVQDLCREMDAAGVDAGIAVQARQDPEETTWLLELSREEPRILGVVGWTDLCASSVDHELNRLASHPGLVGLRHVLQDEPDDAFMLGGAFNRGIARLRDYGLVYDILIYAHHLDTAEAFVDRHPQQVFVIDHIAKPSIRDGEIDRWKAGITELARRKHCYCKLSGVATEANWSSWTAARLRPYLDAVLEAFGPERLMFGSDWPVCLLATEYGRWYELMRSYTSDLTSSERARIFGGTAAEAYGLPVTS